MLKDIVQQKLLIPKPSNQQLFSIPTSSKVRLQDQPSIQKQVNGDITNYQWT